MSIYQKFKKNSHKILINDDSLKSLRNNNKINILKNRLSKKSKERKKIRIGNELHKHSSVQLGSKQSEDPPIIKVSKGMCLELLLENS